MEQSDWLTDGQGLWARVTPGSGEGVLWIHGYTLDSSTWAPLWARLPGWRHVGVDLPGHGRSRPWAVGESLPALGRALGQMALANGVRHIVGLSFGGMFALQVAIEFPTEFATLTLAAAGRAGGPQDPYARLLYRQLGEQYARRGAGPWMTALWMESRPYLFKGAPARPGLWEELQGLVDRYAWAELGNGALQALNAYEQTNAEVAAIQSETLLLTGTQEMRAFQIVAEQLAAIILHSRWLELPGLNHLCLLQDPLAGSRHIQAHLEAKNRPNRIESVA